MENTYNIQNNSDLKVIETVKEEIEILYSALDTINYYLNKEAPKDLDVSREELISEEIEIMDSALANIEHILREGLYHE